ncbi:MAG: recombinase family protein [Limnobacter sp.]|nr:recombinase family protein [Limnobacter sp.]
MLVGYARVSTRDQNLDLQVDALTKAGVEQRYLFTDKCSGKVYEREGLGKALSLLREGDTLVVYKLDRLGRTTKQLVSLVDDLASQGVGFISITESIDTSNRLGKFFFHIMSAMSEMERELIVERTKAGLDAARARGKPSGAPIKFDDDKVRSAMALLRDGIQPKKVAEQMGISVSTLYRKIPRAKVAEPSATPSKSKNSSTGGA